MAGLQEVPTEELLSFQDFTPVHDPTSLATVPPGATTISIDTSNDQTFDDPLNEPKDRDPLENDSNREVVRSIWSLEYYQRFFDVDTSDVIERLIASVTPIGKTSLNNRIKAKPDLYGPLWISLTLIFTIAINGNIAAYLQHADTNYQWKYQFHLVSYAATAIVIYVSLVPLTFWGLLKWSIRESINVDDDDLEVSSWAKMIPSPLEIICLYGYSLFVYIPVSILWTIQVGWFQWLLVVVAALLSGLVLLTSLIPAFNTSRHKYFMMISVIGLHFLLAAGFMLYFFHFPDASPHPIVQVNPSVKPELTHNVTSVVNKTTV